MTPTNGVRRDSCWMVKVGPRSELDVSQLLAEVIAQLAVTSVAVAEASRWAEVSAVLGCTIELQSTLTPIIRLQPEISRWLHESSASLDIDVLPMV